MNSTDPAGGGTTPSAPRRAGQAAGAAGGCEGRTVCACCGARGLVDRHAEAGRKPPSSATRGVSAGRRMQSAGPTCRRFEECNTAAGKTKRAAGSGGSERSAGPEFTRWSVGGSPATTRPHQPAGAGQLPGPADAPWSAHRAARACPAPRTSLVSRDLACMQRRRTHHVVLAQAQVFVLPRAGPSGRSEGVEHQHVVSVCFGKLRRLRGRSLRSLELRKLLGKSVHFERHRRPLFLLRGAASSSGQLVHLQARRMACELSIHQSCRSARGVLRHDCRESRKSRAGFPPLAGMRHSFRYVGKGRALLSISEFCNI